MLYVQKYTHYIYTYYIYVYIMYIYIYCLFWEFLEKSARNIITTQIWNKYTIFKIANIINCWPFFYKGDPQSGGLASPDLHTSVQMKYVCICIYIYEEKKNWKKIGLVTIASYNKISCYWRLLFIETPPWKSN